MAALDDICNSLIEKVPDALGAAVVDLSSGLLLTVHHNVPYFTQSYLDAVAAAAVDMFRGKTVSTVEKLLSTQRGTEISNLLEEVQMTTARTFHFMTVIPDKPNSLLVLITGRSANLGIGWSAVRSVLPDLSKHCP